MKLGNCWVKVCGAERVSTAGPPFLDAMPFAQALGQRGAWPCAVGHRLASPERRPAYAERRRSRRPGAVDRTRRCAQI